MKSMRHKSSSQILHLIFFLIFDEMIHCLFLHYRNRYVCNCFEKMFREEKKKRRKERRKEEKEERRRKKKEERRKRKERKEEKFKSVYAKFNSWILPSKTIILRHGYKILTPNKCVQHCCVGKSWALLNRKVGPLQAPQRAIKREVFVYPRGWSRAPQNTGSSSRERPEALLLSIFPQKPRP